MCNGIPSQKFGIHLAQVWPHKHWPLLAYSSFRCFCSSETCHTSISLLLESMFSQIDTLGKSRIPARFDFWTGRIFMTTFMTYQLILMCKVSEVALWVFSSVLTFLYSPLRHIDLLWACVMYTLYMCAFLQVSLYTKACVHVCMCILSGHVWIQLAPFLFSQTPLRPRGVDWTFSHLQPCQIKTVYKRPGSCLIDVQRILIVTASVSLGFLMSDLNRDIKAI